MFGTNAFVYSFLFVVSRLGSFSQYCLSASWLPTETPTVGPLHFACWLWELIDRWSTEPAWFHHRCHTELHQPWSCDWQTPLASPPSLLPPTSPTVMAVSGSHEDGVNTATSWFHSLRFMPVRTCRRPRHRKHSAGCCARNDGGPRRRSVGTA